MKKIVGSLMVVALMAGAASAAESNSGIFVGVAAVKIVDHSNGSTTKFSGTGYNLGYENHKVYDNGVVFGLGTTLGYFSTVLGSNGQTPIYTFDVNAKLGYSPLKNLIGYAIGGGDFQYINYNVDPTKGYGFNYGAGMEYKLFKNMAVNLEYKTASITAVGNARDLKYDYQTTALNVKYVF